MRRKNLFQLLAAITAVALTAPTSIDFFAPSPATRPQPPAKFQTITEAPQTPPVHPLTEPSHVARAKPILSTGSPKMANLPLGSDRERVILTLGEPQEKSTNAWIYRSSHKELRIEFVDNRVTSIEGSGPWKLSYWEPTCKTSYPSYPTIFELTAHDYSEEDILAELGEPTSRGPRTWAYAIVDGEMTLTFENKRVTQMRLSER